MTIKNFHQIIRISINAVAGLDILRGVRLLTEIVDQVVVSHGALPAPWFFYFQESLESSYGCHRSSFNLLRFRKA